MLLVKIKYIWYIKKMYDNILCLVVLNIYFIKTISGTECYWLCVGVSPIDHLRNLQE